MMDARDMVVYSMHMIKDTEGWCFCLPDGFRSHYYPNRIELLKHQSIEIDVMTKHMVAVGSSS